MYDPTLGRWLTEDPICFGAGDANLYRFVGNNPANLIDPVGLAGIKVKNQLLLDNIGPLGEEILSNVISGIDAFIKLQAVAKLRDNPFGCSRVTMWFKSIEILNIKTDYTASGLVPSAVDAIVNKIINLALPHLINNIKDFFPRTSTAQGISYPGRESCDPECDEKMKCEKKEVTSVLPALTFDFRTPYSLLEKYLPFWSADKLRIVKAIWPDGMPTQVEIMLKANYTMEWCISKGG